MAIRRMVSADSSDFGRTLRASGDQIRAIGLRMGRDQDHRHLAAAVGQTPGQLEPALSPEREVGEDGLRPEFLRVPERLR